MIISPDVPEFISPRSLLEMSSDQLEHMLDAIRERRLRAVQIHEQAMIAAKEASDIHAKEQLIKQCEMLANNIERVTKAIEAMDERVVKVRALRLELGLD